MRRLTLRRVWRAGVTSGAPTSTAAGEAVGATGFLVVSQENSCSVRAPFMTPGGPPDDKARCMGLADRALRPRARTANRIHKNHLLTF